MPINIFRAKAVVLGDPGVGKTSIVQMFASDGRDFPKNYNLTLGVELMPKRVAMADTDDCVELLVYDCGGLDLYVDCLTQFWDQPDLLLLVCDVTAPATLQSVADWRRVAHAAEWAGGRAAPLAGLLFANKTDLTQRRIMTTEQGTQLAAKLGLHYIEGSAMNNIGLQEAFAWLAAQFHAEHTRPQTTVRPTYSSMHKSVLRSSLSNSSLK